MPIRNPKSRTISFRLSEREYTVAEEVSRAQNFESMSDFARSALLAYSECPASLADAGELKSMKARVDAVMKQISDLMKRFSERQ